MGTGKTRKWAGQVWGFIGDVWLAKDLALAIGLPTVAVAILAPVGVWFFTPASPAGLVLVSLVCGAAVFLLACLLLQVKLFRATQSPLHITFDPANPAQRYWRKIVGQKELGGVLVPGGLVAYCVRVENASANTIRNVYVSRESLGSIPEMPADLAFEKDGAPCRDLQPRCAEFVTVFLQRRPQAGDAWGQTATAFHSPIKVIARGDDVLPAECEFDYHPDQIPALVLRQHGFTARKR